MSKKTFIKTLLTAAAGTAAALAVKDRAKKYISVPDNKKTLWDIGDNAVQGLFGKLANSVSNKSIPFINRYDGSGFMEGSGWFMDKPAPNGHWSVGYAKNSVVPAQYEGDLYIGGYLAFPPNKLNGIIQEQMIRAVAIDDNSGRGIHVFAVIDCIGISGTDIRAIRKKLSELISEKNILSINISATHCHSGIDTCGMWGDLIQALKKNKRAVEGAHPENAVSGRNKDFMEYLINISADTIRNAVLDMHPGKLMYAGLPAENFVRDKRPPYVTDNTITVLKFLPDNGTHPVTAVMMAAHPTCYGPKQREAVCDFPAYMCERLEQYGTEAMFIQGAECSVAADRGKHIPKGLSNAEGIKAYGEAIAEYVNSFDMSHYKAIEPFINVIVEELFLPADNKILAYAAKMNVVNNSPVSFTFSNSRFVDEKEKDLLLPTEVGFAELGSSLRLAMVPGELMPEIALGGAFKAWESYNGTEWEYPPIKDILGGELAVIGLCNDFIGYIIPDNDFGSMFAPLHYEESVSAGKKTASNIVSAFIRMKEKAEKMRVTAPVNITEE